MTTFTDWPRRGVYLITPDEACTTRLLSRVEPLLKAGIALLQYRNKTASPKLRREQATKLQKLCQVAQVPLIINDDWRLAAEIAAHGAHLGQGDGEVAAARAALSGHALLGVSCYNDIALAQRAKAAGADYIAFGACFSSGTKPHAQRADLSLFRDTAVLGLPKVAIGGINPDNARSAIIAGADLIAVIGAVFDAPDPVAVVQALNACFATTTD